MFRWAAIPFVRITLFLILGIGIQDTFSVSSEPMVWLGCTTIIYGLIILFQKFTHQSMYGMVLLAMITLIGIFRTYQYRDIEPINQLLSCDGYFAIVDQYPTSRKLWNSYELKIYAYQSDSTIIETNQRCILNIKYDTTTSTSLSYGDKVHILGSPKRINTSKNPGSFDYAHYMAYQKVYYQHWIDINKVKTLQKNQGHPFLGAIFKLRSRYEDVIKQSIHSPKERGIALALLLGIKDELDPKTKTAFSKTGAMHVLAVSGLHVGIIYLMISGLLKQLNIGLIQSQLAPVLGIIAIWSYALLTGFSPSILRASLMFSLLIIAKASGRKTNSINAVAVSAFILLLINPNYLFNVGFQLSYAAIFGILILYERLHELINPKNWLVKQLWSLFCVSVTAQLATAPIGIFYFNQFPAFFLLSNLIVFILIYPIMITGFILMITGELGMEPGIANLLETLTHWLSIGIGKLSTYEWSHIDWLYLSASQVFFVYGIIVCLILTFSNRSVQWLKIAAVFSLVISVESIYRLSVQNDSNKLIFYTDNKAKLVDQIHGLHGYLWVYDSIDHQRFVVSQVNPGRLKSGLTRVKEENHIFSNRTALTKNIYGFVNNDTRFLFISSDSIPKTKSPIKTDYLVLSNNVIRSIKQLEESFSFKTLIVDGYNQAKHLDRLINETKKKGQRVYNLKDQALIIEQ